MWAGRAGGVSTLVDEGVNQLNGGTGLAETADHHRGTVADIGDGRLR
jgi:hypothetical protein